MATLKLKRGAEVRIKAGHPWIYRTQVADLTGRWKAEEAVEIVDGSRPSSAAASTTRARRSAVGC